jgi:hypothetical protein
MVTLVEEKSIVTKSYVVELTQQEVDFIVGVTGSLNGVGEVREVSTGLFWTFDPLVSGAVDNNLFTNCLSAVHDYTFNKG